MEAHDVMRAMTQRARELGWEVETNWKDSNDGTDEYDVYLWPGEEHGSAEERSDDPSNASDLGEVS